VYVSGGRGVGDPLEVLTPSVERHLCAITVGVVRQTVLLCVHGQRLWSLDLGQLRGLSGDGRGSRRIERGR